MYVLCLVLLKVDGHGDCDISTLDFYFLYCINKWDKDTKIV